MSRTVRLETQTDGIQILDPEKLLAPEIISTLRIYGFRRNRNSYSNSSDKREEMILTVVDLFADAAVGIEVDSLAESIIERRNEAHKQLKSSCRRGTDVKEGNIDDCSVKEFVEFLTLRLHRKLLPHQVKAAIHLLNVVHGANFSVPGAGKTAVVLAVYEYLRESGLVNSLFVVGPRSCFMPWRTEFKLTLGRMPMYAVLAGGDIEERRQKYYPVSGNAQELYLTTYQTLSRDIDQLCHLMRSGASDTFFVADEAHYMKQDDGVWANAVLEASKFAKRRCVLTGTPFPKSYADGINLFDVLHPNSGILTFSEQSRIRQLSESGEHHRARKILEPKIDSLYYRVRKCDLRLSNPVVLPPILVKMNPVERCLYDCVEESIGALEEQASDLDLDTIIRLRKGRQIRRRQATSYPTLLASAISGYDEALIDTKNDEIYQKVVNYDQLELPAKIQRLLVEIRDLRKRSQKIVIWANFVGTLRKIKRECDIANFESRIVYGGTPLEDGMDEESRETIIEAFKNPDSGVDILIANPAACAESVSLHKTCSNAIYYDLSYNCAEYLQSLDRIHRVGGSENKMSYYRFLQYANTFEHQILRNLREKASRMADVIDRDFPLALSEFKDLGFDEDEFGF